jgi:hypothetical protein
MLLSVVEHLFKHPGGRAMPRNQPSLPANRAFVVQIHIDVQPGQSDFKGRVEHLTSMKAAHFDSSEELLAFMVLGFGHF